MSIFLADVSVLNSLAFGWMVFIWALADISRFQLYFLRTLNWEVPLFLRWLRYSDFLIQYPLVVIAEAWFVALKSKTREVVGSVVCNEWRGPLPLVLKENAFKFGTLWGFNVLPGSPSHVVGRLLIERCITHWHDLQCTKGITFPSLSTQSIFTSLGFTTGNALGIDLSDESMVRALDSQGVQGEKEWKLLLVRSLPQQLEAVFGENDPFDIISKVKKIQIQHGAYQIYFFACFTSHQIQMIH